MRGLFFVFASLIFLSSLMGQVSSGEEVKNWLGSYVGFEKNFGQVQNFDGGRANDVFFRAKLPGYGIFITERGVSYVIYKIERKEEKFDFVAKEGISEEETKVEYARLDVELFGGRVNYFDVEYEDPLPGYTNYYLSSCPDGVVGVISYRKIRIKNVYPGVDWIWRYEDGVMHHEFEVRPGVDVGNIRLRVKWADVELVEGGRKIVFSTPLGKIEDGLVVGNSGGKKIEVYYRYDGDLLRYDVRGWDGREVLVIDPPLSLLWATYYGGTTDDYCWSITTDANGNVFVTGYTNAIDFPLFDPGGVAYFQGKKTNYDDDIFILKFSNTGQRLWATYYGGNYKDWGRSITTDVSGNVFVTGYTNSIDFPLYNRGGDAYYQGTNAGGYDAFILMFSNSGQRLWATFYGGGSNDDGYSITTDDSGNVFVTGETWSTDFPTYNPFGGAYYQETFGGGYWDAFILKFSNTGQRLWATYYGGNSEDRGFSITTDVSGNIFVTGYTYSTNLPNYNPGGGTYYQGTNAGGVDAFILKFTNTGESLWATYYGGSSHDWSSSITTDASGNVFVTGVTTSINFPTYNPDGGAYYQGTFGGGNEDAFILKFTNTGHRLWATYYGGNYDEAYWRTSITTDVSGNVFVTGETSSTDFPTFDPGGGAYFQGTLLGVGDAFILKFTNTGQRLWATYYGGNYDDLGISIATDALGNVFVAGTTYSTDFPTYDPGGGAYYQGARAGLEEVFILKFGGSSSTGVVKGESTIPEKFSLHQNYPNPFNPGTKIVFDLPERASVRLKVYDILGREVKTLIEGDFEAGRYEFEWDGRDEFGNLLSSGVYFYRLEALGEGKSFVDTKKMVLLR